MKRAYLLALCATLVFLCTDSKVNASINLVPELPHDGGASNYSVLENFLAESFVGHSQAYEWDCFQELVPEVLKFLQTDSGGARAKFPWYLFGDIGRNVCFHTGSVKESSELVAGILHNLGLPFSQRCQLVKLHFRNIRLDQLGVQKGMACTIFRFLDEHGMGQDVHHTLMALLPSDSYCRGFLLGILMTFNVPVDWFSELNSGLSEFEFGRVVSGLSLAGAVPYAETDRAEIFRRNHDLLQRFIPHAKCRTAHVFNVIRHGQLQDISALGGAYRDLLVHKDRFIIYAMIYNCLWNRPELFQAWCDLYREIGIDVLEHEVMFVRRSLAGFENNLQNPIIAGIIEGLCAASHIVENTSSEAFLCLWYSAIKICANAKSHDSTGVLVYILAFSLAETVQEKMFFAETAIECIPEWFYGLDIAYFPTDPLFLVFWASKPILTRPSAMKVFAYAVLHNLPELRELLAEKYQISLTDFDNYCKEARIEGFFARSTADAHGLHLL